MKQRIVAVRVVGRIPRIKGKGQWCPFAGRTQLYGISQRFLPIGNRSLLVGQLRHRPDIHCGAGIRQLIPQRQGVIGVRLDREAKLKISHRPVHLVGDLVGIGAAAHVVLHPAAHPFDIPVLFFIGVAADIRRCLTPCLFKAVGKVSRRTRFFTVNPLENNIVKVKGS